ncbi:efflux RND transporter periplasmic adaptor subunit [Micropruina sonneratiae]|uniref:efflux RND transporter periplasmic adaptor subunit n=1 Tax=Micropruina sonneratiae TaxID=2986940 RepID=UPI0022274436|nr:hypothetical protein [Micropruina sp. KQZ13P-5]MCW3158068.1 hypothetical protein [Micropruina sp. KQZ13P-5]
MSASQVASAKAKLLEAEQALQEAEDDLADAELASPISGTVGAVDMAAGDDSGTITIVGKGNAQATFELPLKTRTLIAAGQEVTVTPAGSTTTLTGTITSISAVETSGTSGDSPTYSTSVTISDPDALLASGSKATVDIPVQSASNVVRVPASAVTPTGTDAATVSVVDSAGADTASTVQVTTGAVGAGWVEITDGLTAGQLVVLADTTADIPSNSTSTGRSGNR